MKKIMAVSIFFILYNVVVFYLGWNVYHWLHGAFHVSNPLVFSAIWLYMAYSIILSNINEQFRITKVVSCYWLIVMEYGLLLFPIANLLLWFFPSFHMIWVGYVIFSIFALIIIFGSYMAYSPIIRTKTIQIRKYSNERKKYRIVIASDFHLGILSNKRLLQKFVSRSNAAKPDIVFLVGDIVDDHPYWYKAYQMDEVMKTLKATYGIYGVLGNHEYYGKQIPLFIDEMEKSGVKILQDETICVANTFYVTGREDKTNKDRKSLEQLSKAVDDQFPWIVMDHTPSDLETPVNLGVDVHLSGHTHLGQMWPNQWITRKLFELDYGYLLKKSTHIIVSSGFGFWGPPIRTNSRSEMWVVDVELVD
ncbi:MULTISPECIES: metallophosphoesterase [unclassified Rummeliibacillus]|uniref:metallophosphoesterase n=1 Tax=unclassified Rummeliibacillus TaxID=2622809 RepID=UPI000E66B6F6|nr:MULTISPECIES: metallophosphoesterase [unclassified Rummeliibacillus]RIJ69594.1 metallophosphoesterase [Rummeliibacillus sp. POC4]RPJ96039.1 metallophosphoesterase [Rummeliibacillus sp. TYF005]